ncbi:MAG TPA: TonB-dependent receptor, partial [Vicinamibacterales bacterium]|nr:TonB-dependent receptor [Vicinamibacterales bacterium]
MRRCFVMLLLILGLAPAAFGQITAGTVSGTVKDETGGVLPGVDVVIKNRDTGVSRSIVTDANGSFTVPGLLPGPYEVRATLSGFNTAVQQFQLTVAQTAALNLVMKVGGATEQVTVAADAIMTDSRTSALSALVPEKSIEELPLNGRNYINLATLQPGIINFTEKSGTSSSTRGVQLNINGMGGRSNSYLIDGANMRGYAGIATVTAADSTLGVDTIQEFRVVTNSYSADYGRAMGGIINIVTKAGGNTTHGSAFEFFRDSKFDAKNYFDVGSAPPFKRNQFGGSLGGAIKKNHIFFFGGYERLQEDLGITERMTVPTEAARAGAVASVQPYLNLYPLPNGKDLGGGIAEYNVAFNRPTRENFGQGRVDVQLNDKHSFFVRETLDKAHQILPSGTVSLPQFTTNSESDNQFTTAEEKWVVTSTLLNTARYSHSILKFDQLPANTLKDPLSFFPQAPYMGSIGVTGFTALGNDSTLPSTNDITYNTFSDDVSWTKGRHFLKTGVLIEHAYSEKQTTTNSRGGYTFSSLANFLAGKATRFVGVLPGAILERDRPNTLFGFYGQDDFRMSDRLTLNLGLRYEFYTVPADKNGLDAYLPDLLTSTTTTVGPPFVNPSKKNIAPRLGFAWDMKGDGS